MKRSLDNPNDNPPRGQPDPGDTPRWKSPHDDYDFDWGRLPSYPDDDRQPPARRDVVERAFWRGLCVGLIVEAVTVLLMVIGISLLR